MIVRYLLVFLLTVLENRVTAQERVEGYKGDNAVLPCIYSGVILKDLSFFWRYKSYNVYDFNKGQEYLSKQYPQFKNRTQVFPSQFEKGNFSLLLMDLKDLDIGEYKCYYPEGRFVQKVILQVKEILPRTDASQLSNNSTTEEKTEINVLLLAVFGVILHAV
ncbi:HERV-H LTR-associating protein 2 precursor [Arapaima gigas]